MGSKSDPPPPPDYTPIASANAEAAKYAYQAADNDLAFRRQVYEENRPREQELYQLASRVAQQQLGIADANETRAAQQWQQHQQTFQPIERQMALEAFGSQYLGDQDVAGLQAALASGDQTGINRYSQLGAQAKAGRYQTEMDSADARARGVASSEAGLARASASADINSAYAQQLRGLARMGMNPNQTAALMNQIAQQQALVRSGAGNQVYRSIYDQERSVARTDAANRFGMTDQGMGLRAGAASLGRNLPNTAAQAYGLATNAGSAATANQQQGLTAGLPYAQMVAGGFGNQLGAAGMAQQGALGMGGLMNQGYGAQVNAWSAAQQAQGAGLAGLGQLGGMLGYGWMMQPK